jgi:hypothetical protein
VKQLRSQIADLRTSTLWPDVFGNFFAPTKEKKMTQPLAIRRVVAGKAYNTETAEFVGWLADSGTCCTDFQSECTGLYRTRKGQWFIAGEGGAASRWNSLGSDGCSTVAGEGLDLISAQTAQELMEEANLAVEAYFDIEEC